MINEPTKVLYESAQTQGEQATKPNVAAQITAFLKKLKQVGVFLKNPKIITLGIIFLIVVITFIALNLMSQKQQEETMDAPTQIVLQSPSPSADPSLENIAKRIELYGQNLDKMQDFRKTLPYPIVDLEINFEEE